MQEFMYGLNSLVIAGGLLVSLLIVIETGYRLGRRFAPSFNEATRDHITSIQGSLLGILALLLGFTFSLALQRYDARSEAVVDEANAIGTTSLRAHLLPVSVRSDVQRELREYVDFRVAVSLLPLTAEHERAPLVAKTLEQHDVLWDYAVRAGAEAPSPVSSGLFIQSLNEMIDSYGVRDASLNRHVPELVLLLLYTTFLMTVCVVGFSVGLSGHRATFATYMLVGLIVLLVFLIIDLDRPRRGLIEVSQKNLLDLQASLYRDANLTPPATFPAAP